MRLFIAEKRSLAQSIAEAIGHPSRTDDGLCYRCDGDNCVIWAAGHLLEEQKPEQIDEKYKVWRLSDLPIIPVNWQKTPKPPAKDKSGRKYPDLLENIGHYIPKAQEVVNCGDADREGQLLIDEILVHFNCDKPTYRLLVTDTNPAAIRKQLADLPENGKYHNVFLAGEARQRTDWLIGMNMSRVFTVRRNMSGGNDVMSVGRVQTPTLGLVVERDRKIRDFVSKPFWTFSGIFSTEKGEKITAAWQPPEDFSGLDPEGRIVDEKALDAVIEQFKKVNDARVSHFESKKKATQPPLPHSLPSLQIECNKRWGMSPTDVLNTLQGLYERGITTYPRSDCQYLPKSQAENIPSALKAISSMVPDLQDAVKKANPSARTSAWNDSKVAEHFAIILTGKIENLSNTNEQHVFDAVCRRYLALFSGPMSYLESTIDITAGGLAFKTVGKIVLDEGWKALYPKKKSEKNEDESEKEENSELPKVAQGDPLKILDAKKTEKKTTPPDHFTEATLLHAMNNIHRYVTDPAIKKVLQSVDGIGTAATQATIIETLQKRNYISKKGKYLFAEKLGETLYDAVSDDCRKPDFTALMEKNLKLIESGQLSFDKYMENINSFTTTMVNRAKNEKLPELVSGDAQKCPHCGAVLRRLTSKNGPFWACTNTDCGAMFADLKGKPVLPQKCPKCGKMTFKRVKSKKTGDYWWICSDEQCGTFYPDHNGKPILPQKCPKCGQTTLVYRNKKDGGHFWACQNQSCDFMCSDNNGKPALPQVCPQCGKQTLSRIPKKAGGFFWACKNTECNAKFNDVNGKPQRGSA